jgi:hypothetical protein
MASPTIDVHPRRVDIDGAWWPSMVGGPGRVHGRAADDAAQDLGPAARPTVPMGRAEMPDQAIFFRAEVIALRCLRGAPIVNIGGLGCRTEH